MTILGCKTSETCSAFWAKKEKNKKIMLEMVSYAKNYGSKSIKAFSESYSAWC